MRYIIKALVCVVVFWIGEVGICYAEGVNQVVRIDKDSVTAVEYSAAKFSTDAFARLRIASPTILFLDQHQYDTSPILWESVLTGGATVTHLPNESTTSLNVTTASGDEVVWQTRKYFRYQPGKSQLVTMTNVLGAGQANGRKRFGYFDANNGIYFEQNGTTVGVTIRSKTSGSVVNTTVVQASWNLDRVDGTGPSKVNLDVTKAQIWVVDFQWLGTGRVRLGIVSEKGVPIYVHEFRNANNLTTVYMTTANLPVRYEITNTAGVGSVASIKQICTAVVAEGGASERELGYSATASNGITGIGVTTRRPILSIQLKLTFNSIENRGSINLQRVEGFAVTNNAFCEVVYNGVLTGAAFASVGTNSITNFDVAATAITGGDVIGSFYVLSGILISRGVVDVDVVDLRPIGIGIGGATPIPISVVCTSFTGTSTVNASLGWKELY